MREKVKNKKLGLKSGEGFFKYPENIKEKVLEDFYNRLIIQLKASKNY